MSCLFPLRRLIFFSILIATPVAAQSAKNTELLSSYKPRGEVDYSDIWGYSADNREYALIGSRYGTSIVEVTDPQQPQEVAFVPGPTSIWRDIKTYSHYAYIITDANDNNYAPAGVQVVDLSGLPQSVSLVATVDDGLPGGVAHNLFVEKNFLYVIGGRGDRGVVVFDLSSPETPQQVGSWGNSYWHDVVVKNDTLYGAEILGGAIEIVDVRDKSNMQLISRTEVPKGFTHNLWVSEDNTYLAQTDEVHGLPVNFWDVSDHTHPQRVATYYGGSLSIAHNAVIHGDMAFISYYYDGLKIFDLSQRRAPVEVGWYDTYPDDGGFRGQGYEGAWGIYPFLPSGNLLISDISSGLVVVRFNGTRAGYLSGTLRDAHTNAPISEPATITQNHFTENDGVVTTTSLQDGSFVFGALPGTRSLSISSFGYRDTTITVSLTEGEMRQQDILLTPLPRGTLSLQVRRENGAAVGNAEVVLYRDDREFPVELDEQGMAAITLPVGDYDYGFVLWGFLAQFGEITLGQEEAELRITTRRGYHETFTRAAGWATSAQGDDSHYAWEILPAAQQPYEGRLPQQDVTGDRGGYVAVSRARFGSSTLTSPVFDATILEQPQLSFAKFYNPYYWAVAQANDTLIVEISNDGGTRWLRLDAFTSIDEDWQQHTYDLAEYLSPTDSMQLRFINREADNKGTRASAFCLLDEIRIVSAVQTSVRRNLPLTIRLQQNYPNPFSAADARGTTIRWQQPVPGSVTLQVYNLLGRLVLEVDTGRLNAGNQALTLDMRTLPAGVYLYRVKGKGFESGVKKMTYLK